MRAAARAHTTLAEWNQIEGNTMIEIDEIMAILIDMRKTERVMTTEIRIENVTESAAKDRTATEESDASAIFATVASDTVLSVRARETVNGIGRVLEIAAIDNERVKRIQQ